jgi:hypothetical protein
MTIKERKKKKELKNINEMFVGPPSAGCDGGIFRRKEKPRSVQAKNLKG